MATPEGKGGYMTTRATTVRYVLADDQQDVAWVVDSESDLDRAIMRYHRLYHRVPVVEEQHDGAWRSWPADRVERRHQDALAQHTCTPTTLRGLAYQTCLYCGDRLPPNKGDTP